MYLVTVVHAVNWGHNVINSKGSHASPALMWNTHIKLVFIKNLKSISSAILYMSMIHRTYETYTSSQQKTKLWEGLQIRKNKQGFSLSKGPPGRLKFPGVHSGFFLLPPSRVRFSHSRITNYNCGLSWNAELNHAVYWPAEMLVHSTKFKHRYLQK